MNEPRARKRGEFRGGRFQKEKKEKRIQKDRETIMGNDAPSSTNSGFNADVRLDTPLKELDIKESEIQKSSEPEPLVSSAQEEERFVVRMKSSSHID